MKGNIVKDVMITQISSTDLEFSESDEDTPYESKKIKKLLNFTREEFIEIKKQFLYYVKVNASQFVAIMMDIKKSDIQTLVQLYQLVDVYESNSIDFEMFSNFLVDMHDWVNRDQSLYSVKLKQREYEKQYEHNPIEKLFDLNGFEGFAYLEQNLKFLRIIHPKTFEEIVNISIGTTTIVNVMFVKYYSTLVILSNDKFINFFDLQTNKLQRRFMLPELQTHLQFSKSKKIIYTGTDGGYIYSWNAEKIFSKQFQEFIKSQTVSDEKISIKSQPKIEDCFKVVIMAQPIEQDGLTCLLNIDSLEIIVTGCSDAVIRLYDNKKQLSADHKCLRGHKKAIKQFSYCAEYKYLISCSYDFDVLIWNIYLEHPLAKLLGHEASLVSVIAISNRLSFIISCDSKGIMRVWDPKTFQTIQHMKIDDGKQLIRTIIYKKEENIIIVGCKKIFVYQFDQSFDPNLTDDSSIISMCYADKYLELHLATDKTIKTWDIQAGILKRLTKGIDDIQTFAIDNTQRRGFLGNHIGTIVCIDLFTGYKLREITDFQKEICFIAYSNLYQLLIGASWDRQIRIYKDDVKDVTLRSVKNAHPNEIACAAFSDNLMLIVTVGRQQELRLWDFEKGTFINKLKASGEIILIKFLDPYPMFVTSDHQGTLVIYMTAPSPLKNKVAIIWKNMFTIMKAAQVNAIEYYNETLILGDENGDIRILQIKDIISQLKIEQVKHKDISINRNPLRFFQLNFQEYQQQQLDNIQPLLNERVAYQLQSWKAYKNPIKQLEIIQQTKQPILITLANDLQVKLWNLEGKLIGILKQGATLTESIGLVLQNNYRTVVEIICNQVKKDLPKIQLDRDDKKKNKKAPFKWNQQDQQDFDLAAVDSQAIFQTLKQLEEIQDKQSKRKN